MGGLGAPFILCPLSERKELLGMSADGGRVILTTSKNIAIRYHMLEQKQETSWTSSRNWFTSRVVKCPEMQKYGAVLDNNTIALWDEEDTALNAVTKMKFSDPIWELYPPPNDDHHDKNTLVIFENGFITSLTTLSNPDQKKKVRKGVASGQGFIDTAHSLILDAALCEDGRVVIISSPRKKTAGRSIVRRSEMTATVLKDNKVLSATSLVNVEGDIVGHCVLPGQTPSLLYLAGDGRLWQQQLGSPKDSVQQPNLVGSLGKLVSVKTPVVIRPTQENEGDFSKVVIYGSDPSEEGALVLLYDLKYDIVVARQGLKMYGTPPIMETVGSNVLIPVGLHVLVLALHASKSLLSGVVGKHGIRSGEEVFEQRSPFITMTTTTNPTSSSGWEVDVSEKGSHHPNSNKQTEAQVKKQKAREDAAAAKELSVIKKTFPKFWEVVRQYKILEKEGQPQSLICNQILPLALEKGEAALHWMLQTFADIPEGHLVVILSQLLPKLDEKSFTSANNSLLDRILAATVDSKELGQSLASLDFPSIRTLSLYLKCRMDSALNTTDEGFTSSAEINDDDDTSDLNDGGVLGRCMHWLTCILDAHYTHFVLGGESTLVEELLGVVEKGGVWMEAVSELEPYLLLTQQRVDFRPRPSPHSRWRTEVLTFV